jgi:hypothetical protein
VGLQWIKQGVRTFWRQPLALSSLFFLFMACISLLSMLKFVGALLALSITPAMTLGLMVATRQAEQGQFPMPQVLFEAFRTPHARRPVLQLGLVYGLSFLFIMGISAFVDGGTLAQMYLSQGKPELEPADVGAFQTAVWLVLLLYLPMAFLFWHAPALVYWHGITPLKSLFFSALACWRNKGALLLYGLGWMGMMLGVSIVISLFVPMLGGLEQASVVFVPIMMMVAAMFFTSLDFTFRDSFVTDNDDHTPDDSSQVL